MVPRLPMMLAALGLASALAAQEALAPADRAARIRRLAPVVETLRIARDSALAAERLRWDTVRAGPLTVLVREPSPAVREGVERAAARVRAVLGADTALLVSRPLRLVRGGGTTSTGSGIVAIGVADAPGAAQTASAVLAGVDITLGEAAGRAFRDWVTPSIAGPAEAVHRQAWADLVVAPSGAAQRCLAGDIPSCALALGLTPVVDVRVLYDSAGREAAVRRMGYSRWGRDADAWNDCGGHHVDAACVRYLLRYGTPPMPVGSSGRESLLAVVLDLGGPGAWGRLVAGDGRTVAERLAAAAGVPLDHVLGRWQRRLIASVQAAPGSRFSQFTALAWIVIFGFLATRSSRWR